MASGVEELLDMLFEMIDEAKNAPLSSDKCIIERDRALDLIDDIRSQFPMELTEARKMSRPSSSKDRSARLASRWAMVRSRLVQVGDLNITVSDTMAAAISPAIFAVGIRPFSWYISAMMVLVLPTASFRTWMGFFVSMSARRWWSMISRMSAWSSPVTDWDFSLWSTSTTRLRRGRRR